MELPIEIIYEISIQNPFKSFMPFLSKSTKKYWERRTTKLSQANQYLDNIVDLIIWDHVEPGYFESTINTYKNLFTAARFIKIQIDIMYKKYLAKLLDISKNLLSIDFCGKYIPKRCIDLFGSIRLSNYRYILDYKDREIVVSKYPEALNFFDYCKTLTDSDLYFYPLRFEVINNKLTLIICEEYMYVKIISEIKGIEYIEIHGMKGNYSINLLLEIIYNIPGLKTCKMYSSTENCDLRKFRNFVDSLYQYSGLNHDKNFIDMGNYIELLIQDKILQSE